MINAGIFNSSGDRIYAGEARLLPRSLDKSANGIRSCVVDIDVSLVLAFDYYPRLWHQELRISWHSQKLFVGRIEDVRITTTGMQLTAFGYWRALDDILYTAMWSTCVTSTWRPMQYSENTNYYPEMFTFSNQNNQIQVNAKKNGAYANAPFIIGAPIWVPPSTQRNIIVAMQFDYEFLAPVNWIATMSLFSSVFAGLANIMLLNGSGVLQTGTIHALTGSVAASDIYGVQLYFAAAPAVYAGEDKDCYIRISNLRMTAATTNRVNTTYTAAAGGGNHNVGSTTGMYVGQRLHFSQGTVRGESAIITAINSSTQIAITLNKAHLAADTVQGLQIFADEIVSDIVSAVNTQNSGQINTSAALIRSPNIDLLEQSFADQRPSEILNALAAIGDNSSPPNLYEVGVNADKLVYFRPVGYVGQVYYVDVTEIETILTLSTVYNDIYARYIGTYEILVPGTNGNMGHYELVRFGALRTAHSSDQVSINQIGLKRTNFIDASTTASPLATSQRDTTLNDSKNAQAKASIKFDRVYNQYGGQISLGLVNPGDTFIIRNYPFTLVTSAVIDRIKSFRLLEVSYDISNNRLSVTPENFVSTLGTLLRQRQLGLVSRRV